MKKALISILLTISLFPAFEMAPTDARTRGIANSAAAWPTGPSAVTFNPSHLAMFDRVQIDVTLFPQAVGLEYDGIFNFNMQVLVPLKEDRNSLGFMLNNHRVTTFSSDLGDHTSLYNEFQFAAGYGHKINDMFYAGGTLTLQRWGIGKDIMADTKGPLAFNLHLGGTAVLKEKIAIGLILGNLIGQDITQYKDEVKENVSRYVKVAAGYKTAKLMVQSDFAFNFGVNKPDWKLGFEKYFGDNEKFIIGTGLETIMGFQGIKPSLGLMLNTKVVYFGYTAAFPVLMGGSEHLISLGFKLK